MASIAYEETDAERVQRLGEEPPLELSDKGMDFGKFVLVSGK